MQTTKCLKSQALGFRAESAGSRSRALGVKVFHSEALERRGVEASWLTFFRTWGFGTFSLQRVQGFGDKVYSSFRIEGLGPNVNS